MLKWYAESFKLTEKQMTTKALRRIWVLTGISLLMIPAIFILDFDYLMGTPRLAAHLAYYISFICLVLLVFSKFVNRFWSRDKYLDEWEKERKHQAMAFAFQVLMYILSAIVMFCTFLPIFNFGQDDIMPKLSFSALSIGGIGIMVSGLLIMHVYLLVTTKPIDSFDELGSDLSLDEVI